MPDRLKKKMITVKEKVEMAQRMLDIVNSLKQELFFCVKDDARYNRLSATLDNASIVSEWIRR
jgi:hypothetical protein